MNVRELIKELGAFDDDLIVQVADDDGHLWTPKVKYKVRVGHDIYEKVITAVVITR